MTNFKNLAALCCLGIAAINLSVQSASAAPITGAPSSGLAAPDVTIDFEAGALAGGTTVTNQFSGVTFQGTNYAMATGGAGTGSQNINGRFLTEISAGILPGAIVFDGPVTAAGFNLRTVSGLTTFEAFLGGGMVESFSAPTNLVLGNNFFGFQGILFDEIRFSNPAFNLDNLQFVNATAVPEPLAVAFLGLGLAGIGFARRKRQA